MTDLKYGALVRHRNALLMVVGWTHSREWLLALDMREPIIRWSKHGRLAMVWINNLSEIEVIEP